MRSVKPVAGEKPDFVEAAVHLYTTGIERVAEAQKKAIDLTINHNAEMVGDWKKQAWAAPGYFSCLTWPPPRLDPVTPRPKRG